MRTEDIIPEEENRGGNGLNWTGATICACAALSIAREYIGSLSVGGASIANDFVTAGAGVVSVALCAGLSVACINNAREKANRVRVSTPRQPLSLD